MAERLPNPFAAVGNMLDSAIPRANVGYRIDTPLPSPTESSGSGVFPTPPPDQIPLIQPTFSQDSTEEPLEKFNPNTVKPPPPIVEDTSNRVVEKTTTSTISPGLNLKPVMDGMATSERFLTEARTQQQNADELRQQVQSYAIQEQEQAIADQVKAEQKSLTRVQDVQKEIEKQASKLDQQTIEKKSFWEAADTGQKIGTLFNTLSALAYAFSRNPDKAIEQSDKTIQQINGVIDQDIKMQERKREIMKEALLNKTNDYNRIAGWEAQQIALGAAKTQRNISMIEKKFELIANNATLPTQAKAKAAEAAAALQDKKTSLLLESAKYAAKAAEQTVVKKDIPISKGPLEIDGTTAAKMAETSQKYSDPKSLVGKHRVAKSTASQLEALLKVKPGSEDWGASSAYAAQVIAEGLQQASFGTDLYTMIDRPNLSGKIKDIGIWLSGKRGEVSPDTIKNFYTLFKGMQTDYEKNPVFQQQYDLVTNADNVVAKYTEQQAKKYLGQASTSTPGSGNIKNRGNVNQGSK